MRALAVEQILDGENLDFLEFAVQRAFVEAGGGGLAAHGGGRIAEHHKHADPGALALRRLSQRTPPLRRDVLAALDLDDRLLGRLAIRLEVQEAVDARVGALAPAL